MIREAVLAALAGVRDPELDEPITDLGFVADVRIRGVDVEVDLRLPAYFGASEVPYLTVADVYQAVDGVDGVASARVRLLDHIASAQINGGRPDVSRPDVSRIDGGGPVGPGFTGTFPDLPAGELLRLRHTFWRAAHATAQEAVAARMRQRGWPVDRLAVATLGDAPAGAALDRLRRRRAALELPADDDAPLLVDDDGARLPIGGLPLRLRITRRRVGFQPQRLQPQGFRSSASGSRS
jgi:metal-sulfur cluster biosynthetic enzyme